MRVDQLLNPVPEGERENWASVVTTVPQPQAQLPLPPPRAAYQSPRPKGQKQPKDAPIFRKGEPKGAVIFPPHEASDDDEELKEKHKLFQVYPMGEIVDYCHHIPYSSDKKTFLTKTGRDAFEVFQYTFKLPGEDKEYAVMWDYNIGLVRITPFFKCCKYSKTTPAKVLNGNPGLREISHSITGGALAAQGYWMPFECAKAVAATFCYNVRHALTPLFGKDFLDICIHPAHPSYGNFKIDQSII
ncbi:DNA-binding domain of Mlu1-box binding protein MBP1, partial [Tothia fuscella]